MKTQGAALAEGVDARIPWRKTVRGQYTNGSGRATRARLPRGNRRQPAQQHRDFVALRTEIANWRWAGVPFYIRTGKRLSNRDARIVVNFRPTPHAIFNTHLGGVNRLVINLQPGWTG